MGLFRSLAGIAGLALASFSLPAAADSPTLIGGTKLIGGPGGAPYHLQCPPDSFLVGGVYMGEPLDERGYPPLLNYVEPVCAYVETNGNTGPHFLPGGGAGHAAGARFRKDCPLGHVAFGFDAAIAFSKHKANVAAVNPGLVLGSVTLYCVRAAPPHKWATDAGNTGPFDGPPQGICAAGTWATSVYGGAGRHVDSFGLACKAAFGPYAKPSQPSQPSAPVEVLVQPCTFCKEDVIANPMVNNTAVDVCLNWGTGCGKPAADAFCQSQGFQTSSAHAVQQNAPPTYVIGDNKVCNESFCTRFTSITCNR